MIFTPPPHHTHTPSRTRITPWQGTCGQSDRRQSQSGRGQSGRRQSQSGRGHSGRGQSQSGRRQSGSGQSGSGQSGIGQSRSGQSAGQPQQPPPPGVPPASGNARQAVEYLREMRSTDGPRPSHASAVSAGRPHMPPAGGAQLASAAGGGGQYARRPSGTSAAECGRTLSHVAMSRPGWASGAEQPESVASASRYKGAYPVDPRW